MSEVENLHNTLTYPDLNNTLSKSILKDSKKDVIPGKAYIEINRLANKYPDNEFLAISAAMTSPDYQFNEKDEDLLNMALKKKYGI